MGVDIMTISEFIYGFDDGSTYPEYDEQGNVYIYDNNDTMMAQLVINSSIWEVEYYGFIMSPSLLRLMAELADTPSAKRFEPSRYVILNGKAIKNNENINWCVFTLGNKDQYLISHNTTVPEILTKYSYTREELEEETKWFSDEWYSVINKLLTPLDVALEGKA